MHISVLQEEFLQFFRGRTLHTFVDATLGAGGHSLAILREHPELAQLIGIDRDEEALALAKKSLQSYEGKVRFVHANFRDIAAVMQAAGVSHADGIFFDLGVSSMQLDRGERGFSFLQPGPLDMRMDRTQLVTAADIIESWSEEELARLFWERGEEMRSRAVAKAIVKARHDLAKKGLRIDTTDALVAVISHVCTRRGRLHPATRVFQALRMAVNEEGEALEHALASAAGRLSPHGRLGVISFQSLEDRTVKQTFRRLSEGTGFTLLTKKVVQPSKEERAKNRRARSAKMRFIEKV